MMGVAAHRLAVLGGWALGVIVMITMLSVAGRTILGLPIAGDVELVQFLMAVSISCFLPWCQWRHAHVTVGFFTDSFPLSVRHRLTQIGCAGMAVMAGVLAWRTLSAAISAFSTGQGSMILGIPLWLNTAALVPGLSLMAVIALSQTIRGHGPADEASSEHHAEP